MGLNQYEEETVGGLEHKDWDDPIASQLEVLLLDNLDSVYGSAVKEVSEHGYGEEVAVKALTRRGLFLGVEDPVKNIVDDALAFLKGEKEAGNLMEDRFDDLPHLMAYTLLEMVGVLREIRPFLSAGEAMWWLLIRDLNILQACRLEEDSVRRDSLEENYSGSAYSSLKAEAQNYISEAFNSALKRAKPNSPDIPEDLTKEEKTLMSMLGRLEKCLGTAGVNVQVKSQISEEEKSGAVRKAPSNREITALLQKQLNLGRTYKGHGAKRSFKSGRLPNASGLILDKRPKYLPETPGLTLKFGSSNSNFDSGCKVSFTYDKHNASANKPSTSTKTSGKSSRLHKKGTSSSFPTAETNLFKKVPPGKKSDLNSLVKTSVSPGNAKYVDGIPYQKSLGKYLPRDEKDELILKLVPQLQELQNEIRCWTEWANYKIMQAARRLSKNQLDLKRLREGAEVDKQAQWEVIVKKLPGMENGLNDIIALVENSKKIISSLEKENSVLKKEVGVARLKALESTTSYQVALEREQKAWKEVQSWEGKNGLLHKELATEKKKVDTLQQDLDKAKDAHQQMEVRCEQERTEKEKILAQAASVRKEREQQEIRVRKEEDGIKQKAEADKQKNMEDIGKLENKFLEAKLKFEGGSTGSFGNHLMALKCLKKGNQNSTGFKKSMNPNDPFGNGGLRQDRECVMCLAEEISVVFVPCLHQVLCAKCNGLHETRGMKDCPSCRTPILRRITARFANP